MPAFTELASGFASIIAVAATAGLLAKVAGALLTKAITVTRADTGVSVVLRKPSPEQSKNERSAEAHKLLELVDAD